MWIRDNQAALKEARSRYGLTFDDIAQVAVEEGIKNATGGRPRGWTVRTLWLRIEAEDALAAEIDRGRTQRTPGTAAVAAPGPAQAAVEATGDDRLQTIRETLARASRKPPDPL